MSSITRQHVWVWLLVLMAPSAWACRYNVRDVGFSDMGGLAYQLYLCVDATIPASVVSDLEQLSYACLIESNVEPEVVHVDQIPEHPVKDLMSFWEVKSLPCAILVSPSHRSMLLPWPGSSDKESLWSLLEGCVSSPVREALVANLPQAYAVVLLMAGPDKAQDEAAESECRLAIEEATRGMDLLPKPVEGNPELVVFSQEEQSREGVFLWSLERDEPASTRVAVIYGRGRIMAEVLSGEEIRSGVVLNLLATVGLSCECGLDRSAILGRMLPFRWGSDVQSLVARNLGVDVENPMVKSEMSRIMDMPGDLLEDRADRSGAEGEGDPLEALSEGYQEVVVDYSEEGNARVLSPAEMQSMMTVDLPEDSPSSSRGLWGIATGLSLLALGAGIFVFLRARRRMV